MHDNDLIFGGDFFDLEEIPESDSRRLQLREGELREVAVLFADIKGFSSISNLFDAETIHRKMDEIMKIFSRCIGFYGGFVDKYMGDGIMALFGAKKASEQDTERAVMAAIKMQQQLRLYNALLNRQPGFEQVELGVRVGINTGLVSVGKVGEDREGDFTVYGPEVNLASRMESNAPVNRIMLPHKTMKQVSRSIVFEPAGLKTVKGFVEPIDCYLVVGPKLEGSLHRRNHATGYIGREHELGILSTALDEQARAKLQVIGIRGEAGLGKTRLVYEFERANQDQAVFLHGACSAISPSPLNLFTSLFETLFTLQVNESAEIKDRRMQDAWVKLMLDATSEEHKQLEDIRPLIAFLLELKTPDPRLKQSGTDLLNILSQAIETLMLYLMQKAAKQGKPVVLVLDDLHWRDEASQRVLEHLIAKLASREMSSGMLLVLMYRLDYMLPDYLTQVASTREIALQPLDSDQIRRLIASHIQGLEADALLIDKVIQLSEGNPFFLEEWCNYIDDLPSETLRDFPVPPNLHAMILSRLDKLPVNMRMMLHKAAVIGQEFFVEILKHIEFRLQDAVDVESTLKLLEEQSMVLHALGFEYSTYFFKHITTREVAYQTILLENRRMLHQLCGEAIEELYPGRKEEFCFALAEHFQKAGDVPKAQYYMELAANSAARMYNNKQALELYQKLLDLLADPESETALATRMKIADIKWLMGHWQESVSEAGIILALASERGYLRTKFDALRFMGIAAFYQHNLDAAHLRFSEGMDIARQLDDKLLLCIAASNLGNWYYQQHDFDQSRRMHLQSLELASSLGEQQRMAKTLGNLGLISMDEGDYPEAEAKFRQSLELAEANRFLRERSIALGNIGYTLILQGKPWEALPLLKQKLSLAEDMNDVLEQIKALGNIATIHLEGKQTADAIVCYQKIFELRTYLGDTAAAAKVQELITSLQKG